MAKGQDEILSPSLGSLIPVSRVRVTLISQDGNGRIRGCSHILTGRVTDGWSHLALLESLSSQNDPKAFWGVNINQRCLGRRVGWDSGIGVAQLSSLGWEGKPGRVRTREGTQASRVHRAATGKAGAGPRK